uniref:Uncharacterized protein n=1 Tax=Triticum urartu TaxID=4572 RepID=A0A8R7UXM1_TRIUA
MLWASDSCCSWFFCTLEIRNNIPNCQDLTGRSLSYQGKQPSAEIEGASPARLLVSWWFPTSSMGETVSSAARSTCWRPHRHQPICRWSENQDMPQIITIWAAPDGLRMEPYPRPTC